jgi:hypothetical protein
VPLLAAGAAELLRPLPVELELDEPELDEPEEALDEPVVARVAVA